MKRDVKKLMLAVEKKLVKTMHEKPSKDALDRLAIFAGFQSWDSFREVIKEEPQIVDGKETSEKV